MAALLDVLVIGAGVAGLTAARELTRAGKSVAVVEVRERVGGRTLTEKNWCAEEWNRGCYVGVMGPGTMTACGEALRQPCGRIHWAGTETAVRWMGYIDGAIESGQRAAGDGPRQVLGRRQAAAALYD